jgi:hypothetical protein
MVYLAIVAVDVILAVVILLFILGARASEEARRHR